MNALAKLIAVVGFIYLLGTLPFAVFQSNKANSQPQSSQLDGIQQQPQKADNYAVAHIPDYRNVQEGSLAFNQQGEDGYTLAPAVDTQVDFSIVGMIARAKVTQTFINPSEEWINAIYVFPLPENAAVDHMQMRVGEKLIQGEIQPKEAAKKTFEKAKREGKKASLLTQSRANVFTNSIANIGPKEEVIVTIEYQQRIEYQNKRFQLRYPMTMTPRYIPGEPIETDISATGWSKNSTEVADASTITPPIKRPTSRDNNVRINILLNSGMALQDISSEFHSINLKQDESEQYHIALEDTAIANQDFVLNWMPSANQAPNAALFSQQDGDYEYGMVMLMPPQIEQEQAFSIAREVVYIIDTSGSMSGDSMHQAKAALDMAIKQLSDRDSFNVIEFNSQARALWSYARQANQGNKQQARNFVYGLTADGGTEILPALKLALENQRNDLPLNSVRQVIFLTDGSVGNEEALMDYILQHLQRSRLFTIGIGSAPNSYFMSETAKVGKGTYTYIGSAEQVGEKMTQLFNKLKYPALTELSIELPEDTEFYPAILPDLYLGEPLLVSYKSRTPISQIKVSGRLNNHQWTNTVNAATKGRQSGLNVNWARDKIGQLTHERRRSHDPQVQNSQILATAMEHHLVSEFTSMVAVDITPSNPGINSKDRAVENHMPKNIRRNSMSGQLPQTATSAQLNMLIGWALLGLGLCILILKRNKENHV